jgi:hypothetical protein
MNAVMLRTADTAQWYALVGEACVAADCSLNPGLEDYLVLLLVRMFGDRNESGTAFSLQQLMSRSDQRAGRVELQEMGDQCLIVAGLFPEQAVPQQVPISYFVDMGARAYRELSQQDREPFYQSLSEQFVDLVDILQRMRELDTGHHCLEPLQAFDLWSDTRSRSAWQTLTRSGQVLPGLPDYSSMH